MIWTEFANNTSLILPAAKPACEGCPYWPPSKGRKRHKAAPIYILKPAWDHRAQQQACGAAPKTWPFTDKEANAIQLALLNLLGARHDLHPRQRIARARAAFLIIRKGASALEQSLKDEALSQPPYLKVQCDIRAGLRQLKRRPSPALLDRPLEGDCYRAMLRVGAELIGVDTADSARLEALRGSRAQLLATIDAVLGFKPMRLPVGHPRSTAALDPYIAAICRAYEVARGKPLPRGWSPEAGRPAGSGIRFAGLCIRPMVHQISFAQDARHTREVTDHAIAALIRTVRSPAWRNARKRQDKRARKSDH